MVDIEVGQIYQSETGEGNSIEHVLVLNVEDDRPWSLARADIYIFETGKKWNVHARTLWRMCTRVA